MIRKLIAGAAGLAILATAGTAHALIMQYDYTGNPFGSTSPPFAPGDHISGSFTIDCDLASSSGDCASLPTDHYESAVLDFSFSAGPVTLASTTPGVDANFSISTDADASIVNWVVVLQIPPDNLPIITTFNPPSDLPYDLANDAALGDGALNALTPGTWGEPITVTTRVPEPAALSLFLMGLLALLPFLGRRRWYPNWVSLQAAS
jgi:hypothetical protein